MRIATWNVNSIRTRLDRVTDFLSRHEVDVCALQETKCADADFPLDTFTELGYDCAHTGFGGYNGTAIVSRVGIDATSIKHSFAGQPGFAKDPTADQPLEARAVTAVCGGVEVTSLYVPNGRSITDRHYTYKLRFLDALTDVVRKQLAADPTVLSVYLGDFNVAPTDKDVWDRIFFEGKTHVTEPERAFFAQLTESGLKETTKQFTDGGYTYWDYQAGRFQKNEGMRIDFHFASPALAKTATAGFVDVTERAATGTSDHAPVIVDYDVPTKKVIPCVKNSEPMGLF